MLKLWMIMEKIYQCQIDIGSYHHHLIFKKGERKKGNNLNSLEDFHWLFKWYHNQWSTTIFVNHHIRSRNTSRQHLCKGGPGAYECRVKDYDGIPVSERDTKKTIDPARIPQYVPIWNKHNRPYISSPTLLTGDNTDSGFDISNKLPYRDRSCSVGNKEMHCYNPDFVSAPCVEDDKKDCENKTHVVWHQIKKQWLRYCCNTNSYYFRLTHFWSILLKLHLYLRFGFFICQ